MGRKAVPDITAASGKGQAGDFLLAPGVVQAQFYRFGMRGEQGKMRALPGASGTEVRRVTGQEFQGKSLRLNWRSRRLA
jgi:hypothetical protein